MRSLFYLALCIGFFSCKENPSSQNEPAVEEESKVVAPSPAKQSQPITGIKSVDDVKSEYASVISTINRGAMDSTSFEYNCQEEKNGRLVYFSENGRLRLLKHIYNEYSHFSAIEEYFLKNDTLFFVYQKQISWSFVNQNQTQDNITENRIYLLGSQPVQCLQKKYSILSGTDEKQAPTAGTNKEIECKSLKPVLPKVALFLKLRNQKEKMGCLEG